MIKTKVKEAQEVDITPMIDIVFQLIIFFMVVMAIAVVYGVAIKFPPKSSDNDHKNKKKENRITVTVASDRIMADPLTGDQVTIRDGILKLNGEEIAFTKTPYSTDQAKFNELYSTVWPRERKEALDYLQAKMEDLIINQKYKTDIMMIQGDMKSYHGKVMKVIDRGKRVRTGEMIDDPDNPGQKKEKIGIDGFSLVPPDR